jgi:hypothetical protein
VELYSGVAEEVGLKVLRFDARGWQKANGMRFFVYTMEDESIWASVFWITKGVRVPSLLSTVPDRQVIGATRISEGVKLAPVC